MCVIGLVNWIRLLLVLRLCNCALSVLCNVVHIVHRVCFNLNRCVCVWVSMSINHHEHGGCLFFTHSVLPCLPIATAFVAPLPLSKQIRVQIAGIPELNPCNSTIDHACCARLCDIEKEVHECMNYSTHFEYN